jgi:hypothetical protein
VQVFKRIGKAFVAALFQELLYSLTRYAPLPAVNLSLPFSNAVKRS